MRDNTAEDGAEKDGDTEREAPEGTPYLDWSDVESGVHNVPKADESSGMRNVAAYPPEVAQETAVKFMKALSVLLDGLETGDVTAGLIQEFNRTIAKAAAKQGITFANSNVMKMIEGLRFEFLAILTEPASVSKKRLAAVKRVLTTFSSALLNAQFDGDWNALERSVPGILGILPLRESRIRRLRIELLSADTREKALAVIGKVRARAKNEKPSELGRVNMQEQLDMFAAGEIDLDLLQFPEKVV